ncbi:MAG: response regulator [Nitrosomonadales bacterium]|nr:response regulator [Nitrosomonadales bacterium]
MRKPGDPIIIMIADDDPEDRMLAQDALAEARVANDIRYVEDGEELMDYLKRRGKYAPPADAPRPGMLLLDLNMPRKDGREALEEIKADPNLRAIPVVILTTSEADEDIVRSYGLGASSYITKPVSFDGLVKVMKALNTYWFEIVSLPGLTDKRNV